jgi:hypothetical protein
VLDGIADGDVECVEDDLTDGKKGGSEDDVANGPSVVQGADDEDQLEDDVDEDAERVEDVGDDPKSDRLCGRHAGYAFERGHGNKGDDKPDNERGDSEELLQGRRTGARVSMRGAAQLGVREAHTQRLRGVPSSANWKPTKPLISRHQNVADINPV